MTPLATAALVYALLWLVVLTADLLGGGEG